jgi:hypothetical protein
MAFPKFVAGGAQWDSFLATSSTTGSTLGPYQSFVYDAAIETPLASSARQALAAYNNVAVLETDGTRFYLPGSGGKEIGYPGLKFLQMYQTETGELWFIFTALLRSAAPVSATLRCYGYRYIP